MNSGQRRERFSRGFTLVELLVVILLLGILAGLIFSVSTGVFQSGEKSRAIAELEAISVALESYRRKFGDYPNVATSRRLLEALDGKLGPGGNSLNPAFPPFLESGPFNLGDEDPPELLDPWGRAYEYLYSEADSPAGITGYRLFSKGPDGLSSSLGDSDAAIDEDNLRSDD